MSAAHHGIGRSLQLLGLGLSLALAAMPAWAQQRAARPARAVPAKAAVVSEIPSAPQGLEVPINGQLPLPLTATPTRVAVADPAVADVKVLAPSGGRPGSIMLLGRKMGATEVRVWTGNSREPQVWKVQVVAGLTNTGGVVQVDVKVVELSNTVMKEVGLNWNGRSGPWSAGAGTGTGSALIQAGGFVGDLGYSIGKFTADLNLLQTNGLARVLAEPSLVALSGQSASFLAGGEIPIPESGGLGTQNVVFKPFGIGLTVSPTVISRDRIALKVAPEASELDYSNGINLVNGTTTTIIPALRTRKADTMIELGDGESYIISGLVSRETMANVNKVPFLGDLPVIGTFFKNVQYSQSDKELVIVVTPHLVQPIARGVALPMPGGRQEQSDGSTTAWGYYLLGPAGNEQMPGFSR
ncbi:MAG TPA: pilus assembly protein N-terminal domain-containing protein [Bordetella sp.]